MMNFSQWKIIREDKDPVKGRKSYSENLMCFLENAIDMQIPVDQEVYALHEFLSKGDPNVHLYMVGGAVRDFIYHHFNGLPGSTYKHKDVDLTTNLSEQEILRRLGPGTPAEQAGVKIAEKESDTFGVVFVSFNDQQYEIAPFRIDIGSADGRRPDRVMQGTIQDDAMRRDLTINNLYYDIHRGKVLDFNENGQGIQDIKNGIARPVGDPFDRFNEDKLRVLRLVRFFSRFNDGRAMDFLDPKTLRAIENFKNVRAHGITPERIQDEFVGGFKQVQSVTSYLQNYIDLDLISQVFPGLHVDVSGIGRLENTRNPRVIFAWLLRGNSDVDNKLLQLKYSAAFAKSVRFLIDSMHMSPDQIYMMVQARDKRLPDETRATVMQDLAELSMISGDTDLIRKLRHFSNYRLPQTDPQSLIKQGFRGAEIGQEMSRQAMDHYKQSLEEFE
jgi:tRNA nucleotidyltransferase/poly(A) polymerase